jgi:glutathione synthase/RimK-type ligase-like ATP-grasp enzyme
VLTMLWGLESDEPLAAVHEALHELGQPALLLDQRRVAETEFRLQDEARLTGYVRYGDRRVALEEITAWYVRPYDTRRVAAVERAGPGSTQWQHALRLEDALLGWLETTSARVVNRPSAMLANGCKPYQLQLVARGGFAIPETLVTTDPGEVMAFWGRHAEVIYKSISGVRSQVTRLGPGDRERLRDVVHCPTQFQEYIAGRDYRAHVIGEAVFACEVRSDADDYRYGAPGTAPQIWAARLPREIEARAIAMTKAMGLEVSGIDLRRTPQDQWYCFEVNPSPGFTFYEQFAGQDLARAIASHLISAVPGTARSNSAHAAARYL